MAELINNVKMRLILPNNDQESFVNAINYNFHQLANIANHVDAKRGEKGEQGLPGARGHEGPKGDRGAGTYVYNESIYGKTSEGYANFLKDNGITKSDSIMYSGKIYNVDEKAKYITDYDSETPSVDFTKDVKQAVIDIAGDANGGMTHGKTNNACAYITQKSANDLYGEGASDIPEKENCVPAVFANGYQPDEISTLLGQAPDRYSISSLKKSETYNIRLGIENFSQYYSVIDFKRDSGGDGGKYHTDFDICKDGGNGNLQEVSYNFLFENESIVSIFKDGSDKFIKIGDNFIFKKSQSNSSITSNGGVFVENSGGGNLTISNTSNSTDNSYIRISKDSSSTRSSYISIDSYSISIQNNHPGGSSGIILNYGSTGSYLELNAESIYNKRTKRINLSAEEVIKLSKSRNYISIDNNNIDICNDDGNEQVIAQRRIKVSNTEVLLSNDVPAGYSHIKLYNVKNGSSSIEVSSSKYIISYDIFDNIKNKNGIGLTDVNIDSGGVSFERTYLASDKTLALASNNNILLFPGKLKDNGNGYIHLYTDKLLIHNNMYYVEKKMSGWYGEIRDSTFTNARGRSLESPSFFSDDKWSRLCVKPIVFGQYITFNIYTHAYGENKTLSIYMTEDDDEIFGQLYDYINSVGCFHSSNKMYNIGISLSLVAKEDIIETFNTNEIVAMCQIGAYLKDDKRHIYVRIHTENFNSDNSGYYDWMGTITVPYK